MGPDSHLSISGSNGIEGVTCVFFPTLTSSEIRVAFGFALRSAQCESLKALKNLHIAFLEAAIYGYVRNQMLCDSLYNRSVREKQKGK